MPAGRFSHYSHSEPWQRARWQGVDFWHTPDPRQPPRLRLLFENVEPAEVIFERLIDQLTHIDRFEALRVCVVEGRLPDQPFKRSILFGAHEGKRREGADVSGQDASSDWAPSFCGTAAATPGADAHDLACWKASYAQHGRYLLVPARNGAPPTPATDFALEKREILFRRYREITPEEPDYIAVIHASA